MEVTLITGNKHKAGEISAILKDKGINVHVFDGEKSESKDHDVSTTAMLNAKNFTKQLGKPVVVDDSGIEFDAYPGFPSQNAKWVFDRIGYEGIAKLLDGKSDKARFICAAAYADCDGNSFCELGELKGRIVSPECIDDDVMPYERIFIAEGKEKIMARISREEKNSMSHRTIAFRKLGEKIKGLE